MIVVRAPQHIYTERNDTAAMMRAMKQATINIWCLCARALAQNIYTLYVKKEARILSCRRHQIINPLIILP